MSQWFVSENLEEIHTITEIENRDAINKAITKTCSSEFGAFEEFSYSGAICRSILRTITKNFDSLAEHLKVYADKVVIDNYIVSKDKFESIINKFIENLKKEGIAGFTIKKLEKKDVSWNVLTEEGSTFLMRCEDGILKIKKGPSYLKNFTIVEDIPKFLKKAQDSCSAKVVSTKGISLSTFESMLKGYL